MIASGVMLALKVLQMCGTKQGGILSPDFFSIYIHDLIKILRKTGIGCHLIDLVD